MNLKLARFKTLLFCLAFIVTIGFVYAGAYVQEGIALNISDVSPRKFKATREIVNTVATDRNRQQALDAAQKIEPITERDSTVDAKVRQDLVSFFDKTGTIRKEEATRANIDAPLIAPSPEATVPSYLATFNPQLNVSKFPIHLNAELTDLLLNMDDSTYNDFKKHLFSVLDKVYENGIQAIDEKGLLQVKDAINDSPLKGEYKNLCYEIIAAYIKPNIVINLEATNSAKKERSDKYDVVHYKNGQTIVDEGEIVSLEAYEALKQLQLIKQETSSNLILFFAMFLLVLSLFLIFYLFSKFYLTKTFSNKSEVMLIFFLYLSTIIFAYFTMKLPYTVSSNLIFILLLSTLFEPKMSIIVNVITTIICMLISKGDMEFTLYYIITGTFTAFVAKFTAERNKIIFAGLIMSAVCFFTYLAVSVFFEKNYDQSIMDGALLALATGLVSTILSIGSAPFWEAVFGIVTPYRLVDLCNPNSPVLRRLTIEAPGTYHHSLIVANLAEKAAFEIGANPMLARTGGYYHDIGKLKYPQYFGENQVSANLHDKMDPVSSVQAITNHVTFGLELAKKYHVPTVIQDFIPEHHGTTLVKYFYIKAKKALEDKLPEGESLPDDALNEDDFRYKFPMPKSKETALVMLADTVEAAVRSMVPSGKSMIEMEAVLRRLIKDKVDDGQLLQSGLTLGDIESVIQSFLLVFKGMYHDRIPYPEMKKNNESKNEVK